MQNTICIIDVMPTLYRGHFAFIKNPRITSTGINTSALIGFVGTFFKVIDTLKPTHIALAMDSRAPTFRHKLYDEYKIKRDKCPEEIVATFPMVEEFAQAMHIPLIRQDGYEADDIMGTIAKLANQLNFQTYLISGDKDIAQLVTDNTYLYRLTPTEPEIYDTQKVCEKWGINTPLQMIDYLALAGDASDNIPGIPGIGPKTAQTLIATYGTIENLLQNANNLKGKLTEKVTNGAELARLSKVLTTIKTDIPLTTSINELTLKEIDKPLMRTFCKKYELKRIEERLFKNEKKETTTTTDLPLFSNRPPQTSKSETSEISQFPKGIPLALYYTKDGKYTIYANGITTNATPQEIAPILSQSPLIITHDAKTEFTRLQKYNIPIPTNFEDIMLEDYILDASKRHDLTTLLRTETSQDDIPQTEIAKHIYQIHQKLKEKIETAGLTNALKKSEKPLIPVLLKMEQTGAYVSPSALKSYGDICSQELQNLENEIFTLAGTTFNLNSPKQLGEILFEHLNLDPKAKRKGPNKQYSTQEEVLQNYTELHPIVSKILEYRSTMRLKTTYADKLPQCINPQTNRIHTHFEQSTTETGRLTSSNPNLQNIPIRTEKGKHIRAAFTAQKEGYILMSADYSQIELRIVAALSCDPIMCQAFKSGLDIHTDTASRIYDCMPSLVTREMRNKCKAVNFGIIYGMSPFGLAKRLHIPRKEAATLIEQYFSTYKGIKTYTEQIIETAHQKGYAETILGRRRYLPDLDSASRTLREAAERNAINTPIQGSAADLIKLAMIRTEAALKPFKTKLILQIHDELLFELPEEELPQVLPLIRDSMINAYDFGLPLEVEIGTGLTWLSTH